MSDEQEAPPLDPKLGGKFLVRRLIGRGGMGTVYEVEHVFTKRRGALKLLHGSYAAIPKVVERFVREASAAGRIGSAHIVETIDAGKLPSGEPYLFMELLEGSALSDIIGRRGRLGFEQAKELIAQAAEGLARAHAANIVHRDVKPDNLFVCAGERPFVKILDFGISKFAEESATSTRLTTEGAPLGTPLYMSPEQVSGRRDIDARADVYSLAVVLYECLTGRVPFEASSLPALSLRIFQGGFTPVSELVPGPPGIDEFMAQAMAVEPSRRYSDMSTFRSALLALGKPTSDVAPLETVAGMHESDPPFQRESKAGSGSGGTSLDPSTRDARIARRPTRRLIALGAVGAGVLGLAVAIAAREHPSGPDQASSAPSTGSTSPLASPVVPPSAAIVAIPSNTAERDAGAPLTEVAPSGVPGSSAAANATAGRPSRSVAGREQALPSRDAAPPSRAARDGLSEKNPFAE